MEKDPVCGMLVRPEEAAAQRSLEGRTYYFCSAACVARFDQAPQRYVPEPGSRPDDASRSGSP